MNDEEARAAATSLLRDAPLIDAELVVVAVTERQRCFVCEWTTVRLMETSDPDDAPPPGLGPVVVPKDGSDALYVGSMYIDLELANVGLEDVSGVNS